MENKQQAPAKETVEQAAERIYPFPFTPERVAFIKGSTRQSHQWISKIQQRKAELERNATRPDDLAHVRINELDLLLKIGE